MESKFNPRNPDHLEALRTRCLDPKVSSDGFMAIQKDVPPALVDEITRLRGIIDSIKDITCDEIFNQGPNGDESGNLDMILTYIREAMKLEGAAI